MYKPIKYSSSTDLVKNEHGAAFNIIPIAGFTVSYLAYDNMNLAEVNSMMFCSSMHDIEKVYFSRLRDPPVNVYRNKKKLKKSVGFDW